MEAIETTQYAPKLEELRLFRLKVGSMYSPLAKFFNLHALSHLTIINCAEIEEFMLDLEVQAPHQGFHFEHVNFGLVDFEDDGRKDRKGQQILRGFRQSDWTSSKSPTRST
jgi:hypothetical protein